MSHSQSHTTERNTPPFDALLPVEMAIKAEELGVKKAQADWLTMFVLAVLAGAFISIGRDPADYTTLTWNAFLLDNLLPVSVGNVIGGAVMVGAVYWFVYLRKRASDPSET